VRSFSDNRGWQGAATLAYFGFLSLMPMLLLAAFLLGFVVTSSDRALDALTETVHGLYPDFNDAILRDVAKIAGRKAWGIASVVALVWSMTPFAGAMRSALLAVFKAEANLHYVKAKLRDMAAVFWLMVFFLLFAASRVFFGTLPRWLIWPDLIDWLISPLITAAVIAVLYRVFAPLKLRWRELAVGGVAAALLLAVIRPVFGLVLRHNPGYGYAFGSLKAIFLLLVWVYYLFAVTLLGSEIMANFHRRESLLLRKLFTTPPGQKPDSLTDRFVTSFPDGAELFHEGDAGAEMFHVVSGNIELRKGGSIVKTARPGDYFGEMSLLLQAPRTATAIARGDARVVVISRGNFETILRENPAIVMSLLQEMGRRLKTTTDALAAVAK
jgi:membrane protein